MVINHLLTAMILQVGEHEPRPPKKNAASRREIRWTFMVQLLVLAQLSGFGLFKWTPWRSRGATPFFFVEKIPRGVTGVVFWCSQFSRDIWRCISVYVYNKTLTFVTPSFVKKMVVNILDDDKQLPGTPSVQFS